MRCNCSSEVACCDYEEPESDCFGMRTFMGPFIDETVVAFMDRCLQFYFFCYEKLFLRETHNVRSVVCFNNKCLTPRVLCQETSTTNLCCDSFGTCKEVSVNKVCDGPCKLIKRRKYVPNCKQMDKKVLLPMLKQSFQSTCPIYREQPSLDMIPICYESCTHSMTTKTTPPCRLTCGSDNCTQSEGITKKDGDSDPEESEAIKNFRKHPKDSFTMIANKIFPPNNSITKLPPKIETSQTKFHDNTDNIAESNEMPSHLEKMLKNKGKEVNIATLPNESVANTQEPHVIANQWAVCRMSSFSDNSKTYQIIRANLKLPEIDRRKTIIFFATLSDGSTITYKPCIE